MTHQPIRRVTSSDIVNHSKYFLPSPGRCEASGALLFLIHFSLYARGREAICAQHCQTLPKFSESAVNQWFLRRPKLLISAQQLPNIAQLLPNNIWFAQIIIYCPNKYSLLGRESKKKVSEYQTLISFGVIWATEGAFLTYVRVCARHYIYARLPYWAALCCGYLHKVICRLQGSSSVWY